MAEPGCKLTADIYQGILAHSQETPELEVCGLIGKTADSRLSLYRVANIAEHPESAYLMCPHGQVDAMRQMRDNNEEMYAIYHSHPTSEAWPSETDLALAAYPDTLQIIVSLQTDKPELRAFLIQQNRVEELEVLCT